MEARLPRLLTMMHLSWGRCDTLLLSLSRRGEAMTRAGARPRPAGGGPERTGALSALRGGGVGVEGDDDGERFPACREEVVAGVEGQALEAHLFLAASPRTCQGIHDGEDTG